jgi:hypothetical protein
MTRNLFWFDGSQSTPDSLEGMIFGAVTMELTDANSIAGIAVLPHLNGGSMIHPYDMRSNLTGGFPLQNAQPMRNSLEAGWKCLSVSRSV